LKFINHLTIYNGIAVDEIGEGYRLNRDVVVNFTISILNFPVTFAYFIGKSWLFYYSAL